MRALVVEDEDDLRECLVAVLRVAGAVVRGAAGGHAGFDAFLREHPDVIVSDLWMSNGTGLELIERVRGLAPEQGGLTPAIAISAVENMRAALLAGFHVFLPKPFDMRELIATMAELTKPGGDQGVAPWTVTEIEPGSILITIIGRVESGDMQAMTASLLTHLARRPVEIVADLRRLSSFSPAMASIAERALWSSRQRMLRVRIVGGSLVARLVAAASCRLLGVPCTFSQTIEEGGRPEP